MTDRDKQILSLVEELRKESRKEGDSLAMYEWGGNAFHTVEGRGKYLNHKAITEKIYKEIKHLLEDGVAAHTEREGKG